MGSDQTLMLGICILAFPNFEGDNGTIYRSLLPGYRARLIFVYVFSSSDLLFDLYIIKCHGCFLMQLSTSRYI